MHTVLGALPAAGKPLSSSTTSRSHCVVAVAVAAAAAVAAVVAVGCCFLGPCTRSCPLPSLLMLDMGEGVRRDAHAAVDAHARARTDARTRTHTHPQRDNSTI